MCLNLFLRGICTLFNNAAHIQYMTLGKIDLYITTCACWQFVKVFDFWKNYRTVNEIIRYILWH